MLPLEREDYVEPLCLLNCGPSREGQSIPARRVVEKLDAYMERKDYSGAERHLLYWLKEAQMAEDLQGQLLIRNEMVGFYRKTGSRDKALTAGEEAIQLLDVLDLTDSVSAGTTFINAATAYSAFGEEDTAMTLFSRAKTILEAHPEAGTDLLGGLYNNMGLACAALGEYEEAYRLFAGALEAMRSESGGELEQAITHLNLADAIYAELGDKGREKIQAHLQKAKHLLTENTAERNGYYAFVLEKCAPAFRSFGDPETAEKLERMAEQINERN